MGTVKLHLAANGSVWCLAQPTVLFEMLAGALEEGAEGTLQPMHLCSILKVCHTSRKRSAAKTCLMVA